MVRDEATGLAKQMEAALAFSTAEGLHVGHGVLTGLRVGHAGVLTGLRMDHGVPTELGVGRRVLTRLLTGLLMGTKY